MSSDSDSPQETDSSEDSDSPKETDSSEEVGDGDLSHLGAAQTKIKSFTGKQKSYQRVDRESDSLAQTVLGSCQSTSREVVPTSGLKDSEELRHDGAGSRTNVIQQNFFQVKQQFENVTVQGTRNLTIGGTQNIGKPGPSQEEVKSQTLTEKIGERTTSRIEEWTFGMIKTSALDKVMEKLHNGVKWITVKGNPGEGKTTVASMALDELHKSGRQVFKVMTPEEFSEVTMTCSQPVILLDDIFGNLEFDQAEWTKWKPVLFEILGEKEHKVHEKEKTSKEKEVTVILVGRDYVLNTASCDMGRISEFFTLDSHVVDMSKTIKRDLQEKHAIWEAISNASGVELDQKTIDTICKISSPHGFPHVCRMFVTLYQKDDDINAEQFFKAPLEFLNQTVQKLMQDTAKLLLFKEMVKEDGKVSVRDLETADSSQDMKAVADSLVGTYLRKDDGGYIFDHPSIYDSVAFNLCKRYPLFVIEKCKLSFLHERLRLESSRNTRHKTPSCESGLVVDISRSYLRDLAKRFAAEISNRNLLQVLSHKAFTDEIFITEIMSLFTIPKTQLLKLTDMETRKGFLSLIASSRSRELLKYIDNQTDKQLTQGETKTVLYGVCRYAASDVLTYLVQTRGSLDMNVRNGWGKLTPLMIAAGTRDSQFVDQIMSLNPDLNASDIDSKTVLHYFCENGLLSAVRQVIDRGTDIDVKDRKGRSPLWYASSYNNVEVVRLLLDRGARMDAEAVVGACEKGNMDVVMLLFERGATIDMTTDLYTPLTTASRGGHVNVMKFLVDKGASVNTASGLSRTPLHEACRSNKGQAAQWLLDHGASRDSRDWGGNTLLHEAVESRSNECVDVLLKAGADVNVVNTNGNTPLHTAAGRGSNACVDLLLKAGADVNEVNTKGNTPLHEAASRGSYACVDVLLKAGADVNVVNKNYNTPLHTAAGSGSNECVDVLLNVGADVNVVNTKGNTPLHESVERGSNECVDVLVKARADVNVVNTNGDTPLHTAVERRFNKCVDVLLKAGADVDSINRQGQTPLHTAVYYKDWHGRHLPKVSVCQTLLSITADINKQDTEGNTPLHRLCQVDRHTDIYNDPPPRPASSYTDVYRTLVTLLVDHGADVNIQNNRGEPALRGWCQTLLPMNKRKTRIITLPTLDKMKKIKSNCKQQ